MTTNKRSKRNREPKQQKQQHKVVDDDELSASEKRVNGNATIGCTLILAYYIGWPDSFIWFIAFLPTVLIGGKLFAYLSLMTCGILYAVYIKYIRKLPVSPDGTLFIDETYAILYPEGSEAREVARRRSCEIDHLVYTCSDLDDGIDYIKKLTGVKPAYGGKHSAYGTHNALLSLGNGAYLELIAVDPNRKDVNQTPSIFELDDDTLDDRLATFAVHHNTSVKGSTFELIAQGLCLEGCKIGAIESGERQTPNGKLLQWKFTDPYRAKLTQPFVIDWGTSKSPAYTSPSGCKLSRLLIQGANVDEIGKLGDTLSKIGLLGAGNIPISFETSNDGSSCLVAEIITPKGKKVYLGDTKIKAA